MSGPREIEAARGLTAEAERALYRSPAFQALDRDAQRTILGDLARISGVLAGPAPPPSPDPYAFPLDTPDDLRRRLAASRRGPGTPMPDPGPSGPPTGDRGIAETPRRQATETLAERTGALIDEVDFVGFVAGLIHGTFDAIVDASIRQMEAFADLVSAVAKSVDQFTADNVTRNQARDHLAERYPQDLRLDLGSDPDSVPRLLLRSGESDDLASLEENSVPWLAEYGLEGQELTPELIEETLVPIARRQLGEARLQTLATMVLLGMNRVVVRDGSITARVRFRAAAGDQARVDFAAGADPSRGESWGARGSRTYQTHTTMVSTVGVNAQTETTLKAELFGEVRLNFASETLPLERFTDPARLALLTRNARYSPGGGAEAARRSTGGAARPDDGTTADASSESRMEAPEGGAPAEGGPGGEGSS